MKRIVAILLGFFAAGLGVCIAAGFIFSVPEAVPAKSVSVYKLLNGIDYFLQFLPAIVFTGFVVSFSISFGRHPEGSSRRFSHAMGRRYKTVMISALACTLVLSLADETLRLETRRVKVDIVNRPKLLNEYIRLGNEFYDKGDYERAMVYAHAILTLDSSSIAGQDLQTKADYGLNREYTNNLRFDLTSTEPLFEDTDKLDINPAQISDTYTCFQASREAFAREEWFNAHYYAEQGLSIASPKDPNLDELRDLSARAWNNLTQEYVIARSSSQDYFQQKYRGYLALMEKDDLQAYYILRFLYESDADYQRDPDLVFYLDIAKKRVEQKFFFVDETLELTAFENVNDITFCYQHLDGTKDIVYFRGMTSVKDTGLSVQYLRDLTIVTINKNGEWTRTMHTPYAKVMPVSVRNINSAAKVMLEISPETDTVPYFLLKSIGRDTQNEEYSPLYTYSSGETATTPDALLFPLSYEDFLLLEQTPSEPEMIPILSLVKIFSRAAEFGYSPVMYGQIFLDRCLYPIFLLVILILLAAFAWNNRIQTDAYFKFSWLFSFPFMMIFAHLFYTLLLYLFKLFNYYLIAFVGGLVSLLLGALAYLILLILVSVYFLARRS